MDETSDLARFGYAQRLRRSMGSFSSFAISFSLISVITGVFANYSHGLQHVGGAVPWSWLIVLVGQTLVALVLADLAARFPLSGYGYQWTSRLVGPHYGFFVGWLLVLQCLTGFPGVCATLAQQLAGTFGPEFGGVGAFRGLSVAVIATTVCIQLFGIRLASKLNNVGVWMEMVGVLALIGGLWFWLLRSESVDWSVLGAGTVVGGTSAGVGSWALSLLLGAWCLTGFEAAADLAEETHQPRRVVPRSILTSLLSAGGAGLLLLMGLVLWQGDMAQAQSDDRALLEVLSSRVGQPWGSLLTLVVCISIFVCGLASLAATSRLLFAMARDRMLPGSGWMSHVAQRTGSPSGALVFVGVASSAVILILPRLDVVTQISAVAGYLGYAGIVVATLKRLPVGKGVEEEGSYFSLGRWARPVQIAALVWAICLVGALVIPETKIAGMTETYLPAKSTTGGILLGVFVYFGWTRSRLMKGEAGIPK